MRLTERLDNRPEALDHTQAEQLNTAIKTGLDKLKKPIKLLGRMIENQKDLFRDVAIVNKQNATIAKNMAIKGMRPMKLIEQLASQTNAINDMKNVAMCEHNLMNRMAAKAQERDSVVLEEMADLRKIVRKWMEITRDRLPAADDECEPTPTCFQRESDQYR